MHRFFALFAGIILLSGNGAAFADSRIYLELPISLEFSGDLQGSAETISGYTIGYGFDFHLGLGLESVRASVKDGAQGIQGDVDYQFTDLFLLFTGFGLNWQIGYGFGDANMILRDNASNTFTANEAVASQTFITIGYPFDDSFAAHVAYRSITADVDNLVINNAASSSVFDLGATALSLGIQFMF